jgi:hypothetical protein
MRAASQILLGGETFHQEREPWDLWHDVGAERNAHSGTVGLEVPRVRPHHQWEGTDGTASIY